MSCITPAERCRSGRAHRGTRPSSRSTMFSTCAIPNTSRRRRRTYLRLRVPPSARRADVIAVPSEYVRTTVIDAFGVDAGSVVVVPHGVDPVDPDAAGDPATLRARYRLGDLRVLVYPAMTHPHKGHRFLVELLAERWTDPDLVLVLLGRPGAADGDVQRAIDERRLADRILRPGRVPDADRDGLIALAEALVFPSEYEGFGAPVLEAMVLGTPVDLQRPGRARRGGRRRRRGAAARPRRLVRRPRRGIRRPRRPGAPRSGACANGSPPPRRARRWLWRTGRRPHDERPGAATRRAVSALRSGHRADRSGDVPDRGGARGAWP